ncbi:YrdB family protein [Bacillus sp. FJAT-49705]|uniref:YrdB family protein n=1 Tax=Cytobacillus citreus TaxID=2833586 RepID=A0ABS5NYZ4_9BACI|nr:YrdB family protein [Cytobacillus citreus]MBS4193052.1 YrdB family protein [Cytobacillus citreus]
MLLSSFKLANLSLRFILELCVLTVYGYWGFKIGGPRVMMWILAFLIPFVIAIIWGLFGSPKASIQLSGSAHFLLEMFIFLTPVVLLLSQGKVKLAWIYGIIVVINKILLYVWEQ